MRRREKWGLRFHTYARRAILISNYSYHNITNEDKHAHLRESLRVLKKAEYLPCRTI